MRRTCLNAGQRSCRRKLPPFGLTPSRCVGLRNSHGRCERFEPLCFLGGLRERLAGALRIERPAATQIASRGDSMVTASTRDVVIGWFM